MSTTAHTTISALQRYESLDALLARIVEEDSRKVDLVADTRRMTFAGETEEPGTLLVDLGDGAGGAFLLSEHALSQLAADVEIPKRYFDRMRETAPDLWRDNVHHWLQREPERRLIRGLRPSGGGDPVGRAWLSDKYRRLDNIEIARTLLPEFENLGTPVSFHQAAVTESRLYVRALFGDMKAFIERYHPGTHERIDDEIQWGVEIKNSEIGAGKLEINGFVLRLICTNGLVVASTLAARHVGKRIEDEGIFSSEAIQADDTAFWLAARDVLRDTISETRFAEVVAQLQETTEGPTIERPIRASEELAQRHSLTEEEREAVLLSLMSEGDMTRWGMLNAITATAQTIESFDRQAELESLGWALATAPGREWNEIATAA